MKYIPKINWANWPTWSTYGTVLVGGFIAGGLSATYPPAFVPMPQKPQAVAVKSVQSVAVDTWSRQAWHQLTEETARLRKELTEICRPKVAPSKVAPAK